MVYESSNPSTLCGINLQQIHYIISHFLFFNYIRLLLADTVVKSSDTFYTSQNSKLEQKNEQSINLD